MWIPHVEILLRHVQQFLALEAAFFPEVVLRVVGMGLQDHNYFNFQMVTAIFRQILQDYLLG